ncbi:hypothetical protein, partial [Brevibacillus sp. H7]|uniref:hypothetical protein n=1 Tax=Brevibacillus sp. H7 TaxID=3349138 RepID=UPI0038191013
QVLLFSVVAGDFPLFKDIISYTRIYKFGHPIQPLEKGSGPRPAKKGTPLGSAIATAEWGENS